MAFIKRTPAWSIKPKANQTLSNGISSAIKLSWTHTNKIGQLHVWFLNYWFKEKLINNKLLEALDQYNLLIAYCTLPVSPSGLSHYIQGLYSLELLLSLNIIEHNWMGSNVFGSRTKSNTINWITFDCVLFAWLQCWQCVNTGKRTSLFQAFS